MTYYGTAQTTSGKYGILLVTKEPGKRTSQQWTGEEFKSQRKAIARVEELNRPQFAPYFAHALDLGTKSCTCGGGWTYGEAMSSAEVLEAWEAHRSASLSSLAENYGRKAIAS